MELLLIDPRIETQPPGFDAAHGWRAVSSTDSPVPCYAKDSVTVRCFRMTLRWPLTKFGVRAAKHHGTPLRRESAAEDLVEASLAVAARGGVCCYMQWTHAQGGSLGEAILYEPLREAAASGKMILVDETTGLPMEPSQVAHFLEARIRSVFGAGVTAADFTEAAAGRPPWRGAG